MEKNILSWDVGIKNLAYCHLQYSNDDYKIIKWDTINLREDEITCSFPKCKTPATVIRDNEESYCKTHKKNGTGRAKKIIKHDVNDLSTNLFNILKDLDNNMDEILIENQPSLKNPKMKFIATVLFSYYIFTGKNVKFISPSKKLTVGGSSEKLTYMITKKLGIKYCLALLNDQSLIDKIKKCKKKDDLADCFLQGFRYVFKTIPDKYLERLKTA